MNHQEIIELLPWYVNATLSSEEKAIVASHLEGCAECAGEVRSLTAMRKAVIAVGDQAPDPSPFLLNRALAEIESYERQRGGEGGGGGADTRKRS
jgi:anti-sigma factor RsiW